MGHDFASLSLIFNPVLPSDAVTFGRTVPYTPDDYSNNFAVAHFHRLKSLSLCASIDAYADMWVLHPA